MRLGDNTMSYIGSSFKKQLKKRENDESLYQKQVWRWLEDFDLNGDGRTIIRILGFDISLNHFGYALIFRSMVDGKILDVELGGYEGIGRHEFVSKVGVYKANFAFVSGIIMGFNPDFVVVEKEVLGASGRVVDLTKSSLYSLSRELYRVIEIPFFWAKQAAVNKGRASKEQMMDAFLRIYPRKKKVQEDAVDAFFIAKGFINHYLMSKEVVSNGTKE